MRVALCQFDPVIGAVAENLERILAWAKQAHEQGADCLILPELALTGYLPKDMLFQPELITQVEQALLALAKRAPVPCLVGAPARSDQPVGQPFLNAAFWCASGQAQRVATKRLLPNYDVFDERRYFEPGLPGAEEGLLQVGDLTFGVTICEDAWNDELYWPHRRYVDDPVAHVAQRGADVLVNIGASPFSLQKPALRESVMAHLAKRYGKTLLVVGQVGANDQILFDGSSSVFDPEGRVVARAKVFAEALLIVDLQKGEAPKPQEPAIAPILSPLALLSEALVAGIRDYVLKCRAQGLLLGLSGGVDSALAAVLAVRALGADRVKGIAMPSQYSSAHSLEDARELAANLRIAFEVLDIEPIVAMYRSTLADSPAKPLGDIVDQNLQARVRGMLLMARSNAGASLVVATGNKSEMAVGYATLYGDMCGAIAPLADVYKTQVWQLARFLNADRPLIPERTLTKLPSAELKPNQIDQDSLPPYELLDAVLVRYIEQRQPVDQIAKETQIPIKELKRLIGLVHHNDYKREQAPVILKVSECVFGASRRWPIVKGFDPFA